jgi:hypothetical protein
MKLFDLAMQLGTALMLADTVHASAFGAKFFTRMSRINMFICHDAQL